MMQITLYEASATLGVRVSDIKKLLEEIEPQPTRPRRASRPDWVLTKDQLMKLVRQLRIRQETMFKMTHGKLTIVGGYQRSSNRVVIYHAYGPGIPLENRTDAAVVKDVVAAAARIRSIASDDPEPLIVGSRVPVYLVAALRQGQSVEEIKEDLPELSLDQIERAISYAATKPRRSGPHYPTRSFKRALVDLANQGAFDDLDDRADD